MELLAEHDLPITGLDWAPKTNRIVSCAQDKNAFVWTFDGSHWKPELVILRMHRAATCIKWSPYGLSLSSKYCVLVEQFCSLHYEEYFVCWARVFSAYVKEVDEKPSPNPWGSKMPFGALMCEVKCPAWVHHVAFSPSGCRMAYVSHDSTIAVIDTNRSLNDAVVLHTIYLPFTSVRWDQLKFVTKLDVPSEHKSSNINSAMQKFRNIDRNAAGEAVDVRLRTLHQNAITSALFYFYDKEPHGEILPHSGRYDNVQKFSTCAIDGVVALWDLRSAVGLIQCRDGQDHPYSLCGDLPFV
ncbi:unnamed protein product [Gongylonema pulchrum]|uniref:Arp2/3 complex 41 kDa subunit n=1 Tax=Gongylonema pulchrum TaxID=637853 RepID=A0A183E4U5_9BILA|nr:unnamed protein product [Gongylonema pulchrum]